MQILLMLALAGAPTVSPPVAHAQKHLAAKQLEEVLFDLSPPAVVPPAEAAAAGQVLLQAGQQAQKDGDPLMALQFAQMARRQDPASNPALALVAELSLEGEAFGPAEEAAGAWLQRAPQDAHAHLLRARIAASQNDQKLVLAVLEGFEDDAALAPAEQALARTLRLQAVAAVQAQTIREDEDRRSVRRTEVARRQREEAFARQAAGPARAPVVLYSTTWCTYCKQARAYLEKRNIAYEEKDIEADPDALAELTHKAQGTRIKLGSVPVLDVKGTLIQGFNPRQIDELLAQDTQ
jgi:glutaredoxin